MPPPLPTPVPPVRQPGLFEMLNRFWSRMTEGLELNQLWSQFKSDARASYRLYSRDFEKEAPERNWRHNFFATLQAFCWAILEKLTPARRVLLLVAVLCLIFPGTGFSYHGSNGELQVVELDFHFFGGLLLLLVLMLEVADRVVMKRDLEIARDIQRWLLPATAPEVPDLAIAFATRAANTVAGDYYDVFPRAGESAAKSYLVAVADVAGKSIPAALLMATFQASLKTLSSVPCSLDELVRAMNEYACSNSQNGVRFTTAFLSEYDPASRQLRYINAGHNAPMLRRKSGAMERLTVGGLPLGMFAGTPYEAGTVQLESGDWLIIFTDGLIEAINERDEEYGETRLETVLQYGAAASPEELLRRMMFDVDVFVGTTPQHDDITCLLLKVAPAV